MSVIHRSSCRAGPRTVITAVTRGSRWELIRIRIRDRLLARWRGLTLDAQLANGLHVEDDRLRAVRASTLTTLASHKLATGWENVLDRTGQPRQPIDSHVPVRPSCVLAAKDDIRQMIALLRASTPVSARGVAIANLLLTDGTGPLYNSASTSDLVATVRHAISYLDPMTDLPT
jgi:hypothetical protein